MTYNFSLVLSRVSPIDCSKKKDFSDVRVRVIAFQGQVFDVVNEVKKFSGYELSDIFDKQSQGVLRVKKAKFN